MKQEQIREYILLMLGAPVIKIDLAPEQLDACISTANHETDKALKDLTIGEKHRLSFFLERSAIEAMFLLNEDQIAGYVIKPEKQLSNWKRAIRILRSRSR